MLKRDGRKGSGSWPEGAHTAGGEDSSTVNPDPSVMSFPDGIKVWRSGPDDVLDICFVHGLSGNRDSTWRSRGQDLLWPETFLPSRLPQARLLTYGYDAYVSRGSTIPSRNRLHDHAVNLLNDLTSNRESVGIRGRGIVFVAHSLGGIVCKETVLLSRNSQNHAWLTSFAMPLGFYFSGRRTKVHAWQGGRRSRPQPWACSSRSIWNFLRCFSSITGFLNQFTSSSY